jgi:DNA processing protein
MNNGLKTVAFLGCGINYIYPAENFKLYKDIEENGLIVSEYPDMVQPDKENFPFRNRLIAGISSGVLAIEGKNRSGTSTTVSSAAAFGKTVMAIPTQITDENDSLCNLLIRDGATLVTCGQDVNEEI